MERSSWRVRNALAVLLTLAAGPGFPETQRTGTTGGVALKLPAGARPAGLGGAFVGVADDLNALSFNPAGLARMNAVEVSLLHAIYLVDTSYDALTAGFPLASLGAIGASVNVLDYGSLPRNLERPDGLFGGQFGTTSPQDIFLTGGWGASLPPILGLDRLQAGLNLKLAFEQLTGGTSVGIGTGAGVLWETPVEGLRLGTTVDNLGGVAGQGRLLPIAWTVGGSLGTALADQLTAIWAVDTRLSLDTSLSANMGVEVVAFDVISVRGGWRGGGALGGATVGGGLHYPLTWFGQVMLFKLDYGMATTGELERVHRFQLGIQFGGVSGTVKLGSVRINMAGGDPVLTWKGKGPAYEVLVKRQGEDDFHQLTDRPIEDASLPLVGLPAGRYRFKIVTVDPYQPDWKGAESPEIEADLVGAPLPR